MIRFGVVGTGWRTEFFLRIARACPEVFTCVGVVSRDPQKAAAWAAPYDATLFGSIDELLGQAPQFVVTSVPWDANPGVIEQLVSRSVPVLSETPPARSVEEMAHLYRLIGQGAKIAVAEQFHLQPHHAARIAFVQSGKLGRISQVQMSVSHGYHALSLIRRLLGIMYEPATITAYKLIAPLMKPLGRNGPPEREEFKESGQVIALLEFGDRTAVYDFNDDQYFSPIRGQRVTVRGDRGEIVNDRAIYMQDYLTPVTVDFRRSTAGESGNHEGFHLRGIQAGESWVYRNPLTPARLNDEEIAIGTCLLKMAEYAEGGEAFYPLAEACQDRYLDIMIWKSIESGQPVRTEPQAWSS